MEGGMLKAGAGARLKQVAIEARNQEWTGFEFLEGIPGSVGGALRMNAGAMGSAFFDLVELVEHMGRSGEVVSARGAALGAVYRSCDFFESHIALNVLLRGAKGARAEIERRMRQFSEKRWSTQPAAPSAGCMFKNPEGIPAGRLIDELGLKGARVGGAVVSQEHGNFLVTEGGASSRDVLDLMRLIREKALSTRGIPLESEVLVIGEEASGVEVEPRVE
jgi:UDP-N-acetylenolpyruvoylglucosamine reductase